MSLKIARESPVSSDGRALIDGSEAAIRSVLDQDECFTFTADELDRPDIDFFVARLRNKPIGCVALCHYAAYAEIKRLFVTPAARGTGTARALMHYFEAEARNAAHTIIRLETARVLAAGVALYRSIGYKNRDPFGDYAPHPASHFMEKNLRQ